jgi:predicted nucleic acid-binding protein
VTPTAVVLDSGALVAIERGDDMVRAFVQVAVGRGRTLVVPAPVVAEVWRGGVGRQARLARFLVAGVRRGHVAVEPLDFAAAREVGLLLARADVSVADAAVAWAAVRRNGIVLTSDPNDIGRLLPPTRIEAI